MRRSNDEARTIQRRATRVLGRLGRIPSSTLARVSFPGPLSRTELREVYQASDIFAYPQLTRC